MNDIRISPLFFALSLSLGLLSESPAIAQESGNTIEAGIQAYEAGDFGTAAYFLAQARNPTPQALYLLGTLYQHGLGVKPDDAATENLFTAAAWAGSVDAELQLGLYYLDFDIATAEEWLQQAAAHGRTEAGFVLERIRNGEFNDAC